MGAATQTASHDLEMKQAISFLIAVSCAGAALANVADWHNYTQTEHVFTEQVLNHFDMTDERVWAQRYFEIRDFWKAGSGPIFLHICGEVSLVLLLFESLAKRFYSTRAQVSTQRGCFH